MRVFTNMLWYRVVRVKKVKWSRERVQETVGHSPCMPALTKYDTLNTQIQGRLAYSQRKLTHVFITPNEHTEIGSFTGV